MRLWSIHPKYLDAKGIVALWREGLLARKVLENKTKGYRQHPQLYRFKECPIPLSYIDNYLHYICDEADARGYSFNRKKLNNRRMSDLVITVTKGQMDFEWGHLLNKLQVRSIDYFARCSQIKNPKPHPLFKVVRGEIERWEIIAE